MCAKLTNTSCNFDQPSISIDPIEDGRFLGYSRMGGQKDSPILKSVIHIL